MIKCNKNNNKIISIMIKINNSNIINNNQIKSIMINNNSNLLFIFRRILCSDNCVWNDDEKWKTPTQTDQSPENNSHLFIGITPKS